MRSAFAVFLRGFTLPFGVQTGRRIVFDGTTGSISIYDANNRLRLQLGDPNGIYEPGSVLMGTGDVNEGAPAVISAFLSGGPSRLTTRWIGPAWNGVANTGIPQILLHSESEDGTTSPADIVLRSGTPTVQDLRISIEESASMAEPMGSAVLVAGTVVVNHSRVTANSRIFLCCQTPGGTPGFLRVSARTAGTSFTILSSNAADTSTVAWLMFEPI